MADPTAEAIQFLLSQVRTSTGSLEGGKVYFYLPGTTSTTGVYVWLDKDELIAANNPYTLDSNATAQIYANGSFRIIIKDKDDITCFDRDNLDFHGHTNFYATLKDVLNYPLLSKTGDYTIEVADLGVTLIANKATAIAFTFPTISTLASGWWVKIKNVGAGVLTLTGTIDAVVNRTMAQYDEATIFSTATTLHGSFVPKAAVSQTGSPIFAVDTGAVNAYVVSYSPAVVALTTGMTLWVKIINANTTTTPTLAVNAVAAKTIIRNDAGGALYPGDLKANGYYLFQWDGTNFRVTNPYFNSVGLSKCRIHLGSAQNIGNSPTKILLDTSGYDTDSIADIVTNHRITPQKVGYYLVNASAQFWTAAPVTCLLWLYKNGAAISGYQITSFVTNTEYESLQVSDLVYCNGSTDYLEIWAQDTAGSSALTANSQNTYMSLVGPF